MKSIIAVITLSITCIVLAVILGRYSVKCEDCTPCIDKVKYIEVEVRKAQIKLIENETRKIDNIIVSPIVHRDKSTRDSLRSLRNPR